MFSDPVSNVRQFMLGEGMLVADLGAGSGAYTLAAARAVRNGRVYAVEVQKEMVAHIANIARANGLHNVEVLQGDIERYGGTKLSDQAVDAAIAGNVLFQIERKDVFARETMRILKPGGKLLLVDWSGSFEGIGPHSDHVVQLAEARAVFETEGFIFDRTIEAGENHWGMILRKK